MLPHTIVVLGTLLFVHALPAAAAAAGDAAVNAAAPAPRTVLRLDGTWDVAEGSMDVVPAAFGRRVPVPGMADLAEPPFADVGVKSDRRQAFWYRTTFSLPGAVPPTAC